MPAMKVLIVADHATARWGGEAILPLHIFRGLRTAEVEAWLCVSEANRAELEAALGDDRDRVRYVEETPLIKKLKDMHANGPGYGLPRYLYFFMAILALQYRQRAVIERLIDELGIDLVHQPTPVSPRIPSFLGRLKRRPLVVGPLNGAMVMAPGFAFLSSRKQRFIKKAAQIIGKIIAVLIDGRRHADLTLVANVRTKDALRPRQKAKSRILVENGIDPNLWMSPLEPAPSAPLPAGAPLKVIFVGRLERWKGVEWLVDAAALAMRTVPIELTIVGDYQGARAELATRCRALGIERHVKLTGWVKQEEAARLVRAADVFVLPSVLECGGAVVLEAMAAGKPVIAVGWGGPADYLDASCGVLLEPHGPERLTQDLARALEAMAAQPERRARLGAEARARVLREFTWPAKIGALIEHYRFTLGGA